MNCRNSTSTPEARKPGLDPPRERLAPPGTIPFLQQFEARHADYGKDRHTRVDNLSADDTAQSIKCRRDAQ